ncbi:hypothetical protein CEUSTIGMA_g7847.t1 [Chlamydomonas eustigma]|uniref:glucosamine-phosphate N-acetyltransferase n=1 Tax=Chlamydomonas eustigma TaxID=1157962 RepID=A0A250XBF2_9CHLO|nr:hypothetical protein CEUSTIGMA_g7847.t1 [Chlamydomonas eustigma]|eukprot:GAX80408.1 hypothetical protein CEUSTIGMA_g7847.t1 [Chlamydomonas eustigma]
MGEDILQIRDLQRTDNHKGYLNLLAQLTSVGDISDLEFEERFNELETSRDYQVLVIEDTSCSRVVGTATLLIERKFIHNCGKVAHVEDVVVDDAYRGKQLGKRLIEALIQASKATGCYKVILDCSEANVSFYEKCGLKRKEVQMDYINSVEALAEDQRRELQRVREEKRDIEKVVFKQEVHGGGKPAVIDFQNASISDMPPKLRMVFEENKVMKDKLRKYKHQNQTLESDLLKRNNQIVVMEDTINVLKQQLQACSRTPEEVDREENLRNLFKEQVRKTQDLEHEVAILKQKIEVDAKLNKQSAAVASREHQQLKNKLVVANANMDEKDKELRAALLEVKKLTRKLAPNKAAFLNGFEEEEEESTSPSKAEEMSHVAHPVHAAPAQDTVVKLVINIKEVEISFMLSDQSIAAGGSRTLGHDHSGGTEYDGEIVHDLSAASLDCLKQQQQQGGHQDRAVSPLFARPVGGEEETDMPEAHQAEEPAAAAAAVAAQELVPLEPELASTAKQEPHEEPAAAPEPLEHQNTPATKAPEPEAAPPLSKRSYSKKGTPETHLSKPKAVPYSRTYARAGEKSVKGGDHTPPSAASSMKGGRGGKSSHSNVAVAEGGAFIPSATDSTPRSISPAAAAAADVLMVPSPPPESRLQDSESQVELSADGEAEGHAPGTLENADGATTAMDHVGASERTLQEDQQHNASPSTEEGSHDDYSVGLSDVAGAAVDEEAQAGGVSLDGRQETDDPAASAGEDTFLPADA